MTQKVFLQAENPKKTEFDKYSLIVTHDLATSDPFPYDQGFYSLLLFLIAHESSYSQACEVKENHIKKQSYTVHLSHWECTLMPIFHHEWKRLGHTKNV